MMDACRRTEPRVMGGLRPLIFLGMRMGVEADSVMSSVPPAPECLLDGQHVLDQVLELNRG